jgi:hypothetical protein
MPAYKDFLKSRRYEHAVAVDVSSADVALVNCDRIFVGTGGALKLDTVGGEIGVTFTVATGGVLDVAATKIYHTGTNASGIIALYSLVGS